MVTDRVGDFIIRLQNAALAGKATVTFPHSSHILEIAKKLKQLGFIAEVGVKGEGEVKKTIEVTLAFDERGVAKLRGVKRISKPGRRLYVPAAGAHRVKGGTGARVISSPKGIVSDSEARKAKVGGEDLFEIW
ncbi:MAG TPA: 30S ribosomal protein S8 [Candidatus Paceibacterota bacterium]|nr:30S ribosomal protein S8 [Candidatus Paceibacterota bacterium]